MTVLAALLAASAAVLACPSPASGPASRARRRLPPTVLVVPIAVLPVVLLHGRQLVLGVVGVLVVAAGQRLLARRRAAADAADRAARVQAYCESVAADLAAGQPPHRVLARSVDDFPEFTAAAAAAELGADVPDALRQLARAPGAGELRLVAPRGRSRTGPALGWPTRSSRSAGACGPAVVPPGWSPPSSHLPTPRRG